MTINYMRHIIKWYNKDSQFVFIGLVYLLMLAISSIFILIDNALGINVLFRIVLVLGILYTAQWSRYYLYLTLK